MTKIVYNACYGGFNLSDEAKELFLTKKGIPFTKKESNSSLLGATYEVEDEYFDIDYISRSDPILVEVLEELGSRANTTVSDLKIAELEPGTKYRIDEYDGYESVMTIHDYTWDIA